MTFFKGVGYGVAGGLFLVVGWLNMPAYMVFTKVEAALCIIICFVIAFVLWTMILFGPGFD